ncbi:sulfurtransferase [Candidatus Obscuribacterales bacterium]|nr:sulfurtransferase [Candidatus Obscuribacterales bacterium]
MEISATQLKERLDRGEEIVLLDIRKPYELSIASLENVMHIPEEEIADRLDELRNLGDRDVVVYCRTGRRSTELVAFLEQQGLKRIFNLTGGLHAWSDDVDPEVMKY